MENKLTLGSLFDGSGSFPLAGIMCGITPVWASEIEPFPIRVTTKRLPQMKHYGDICSINGAEIESVDLVTFGFPCQSVSILLILRKRDNLYRLAYFVGVINSMLCSFGNTVPEYKNLVAYIHHFIVSL